MRIIYSKNADPTFAITRYYLYVEKSSLADQENLLDILRSELIKIKCLGMSLSSVSRINLHAPDQKNCLPDLQQNYLMLSMPTSLCPIFEYVLDELMQGKSAIEILKSLKDDVFYISQKKKDLHSTSLIHIRLQKELGRVNASIKALQPTTATDISYSYLAASDDFVHLMEQYEANELEMENLKKILNGIPKKFQKYNTIKFSSNSEEASPSNTVRPTLK